MRNVLRQGDWVTRARIAGYARLLLCSYALFLGWLFLTSDGVLDRFGRPLGTDFAGFWAAGKLIRIGRVEAVFDPEAFGVFQRALFGMTDQLYGWHYPPMFLAVAAVLGYLPYLAALVGWVIATGALYLAAVRRILAPVGVDGRLVALVACAYPAAFMCTTQAQNGFLTAGLFGFGLALLPSRPATAGVFLGLLAYKPQYGLLVPLALVAMRAWPAVFSATLTVVGSVIAAYLLFGLKSFDAFFTFAGYTRVALLEGGAAGWFKLQGFFPTVRMWGGSVQTAYAAQGTAMLLIAAAVAWLWTSRASYPQKAAGLLIATLLSTPYSFNYDLLVLGPAIAFLVADGLARGFAPYQKSVLALLFVTPLVAREVAAATLFPLATAVQVIALVWLVATVRTGRFTVDVRPAAVPYHSAA